MARGKHAMQARRRDLERQAAERAELAQTQQAEQEARRVLDAELAELADLTKEVEALRERLARTSEDEVAAVRKEISALLREVSEIELREKKLRGRRGRGLVGVLAPEVLEERIGSRILSDIDPGAARSGRLPLQAIDAIQKARRSKRQGGIWK